MFDARVQMLMCVLNVDVCLLTVGLLSREDGRQWSFRELPAKSRNFLTLPAVELGGF